MDTKKILKGCCRINSKERFLEVCSNIKREGMDKLLEWLSKTDFYTCPASTKFHGACVGGLLEHSLSVYEEAKKLLSLYTDIQIDEESIAICTLFHDLCKVNFYKTEQRNRKNENGQWEKFDAYTVDEKFPFGGHGSKSVFLLQNFIKLTPEEAVAINCHMSSWDGATNVGKSYEKYPFAWLLHVADEAATFIKGC